MDELWSRFVDHILHRLDGPMHFRLIVQPLMAVIFATLDGCKDAGKSKPAYFWALLVNPGHRRELLKDGWKHFGKIFIAAAVLDVAYQLKVHQAVFPVETLFVAMVLAVLPYVFLRGPVNRIVTLFKVRKRTTDQAKQEFPQCTIPADRQAFGHSSENARQGSLKS